MASLQFNLQQPDAPTPFDTKPLLQSAALQAEMVKSIGEAVSAGISGYKAYHADKARTGFAGELDQMITQSVDSAKLDVQAAQARGLLQQAQADAQTYSEQGGFATPEEISANLMAKTPVLQQAKKDLDIIMQKKQQLSKAYSPMRLHTEIDRLVKEYSASYPEFSREFRDLATQRTSDSWGSKDTAAYLARAFAKPEEDQNQKRLWEMADKLQQQTKIPTTRIDDQGQVVIDFEALNRARKLMAAESAAQEDAAIAKQQGADDKRVGQLEMTSVATSILGIEQALNQNLITLSDIAPDDTAFALGARQNWATLVPKFTQARQQALQIKDPESRKEALTNIDSAYARLEKMFNTQEGWSAFGAQRKVRKEIGAELDDELKRVGDMYRLVSSNHSDLQNLAGAIQLLPTDDPNRATLQRAFEQAKQFARVTTTLMSGIQDAAASSFFQNMAVKDVEMAGNTMKTMSEEDRKRNLGMLFNNVATRAAFAGAGQTMDNTQRGIFYNSMRLLTDNLDLNDRGSVLKFSELVNLPGFSAALKQLDNNQRNDFNALVQMRGKQALVGIMNTLSSRDTKGLKLVPNQDGTLNLQTAKGVDTAQQQFIAADLSRANAMINLLGNMQTYASGGKSPAEYRKELTASLLQGYGGNVQARQSAAATEQRTKEIAGEVSANVTEAVAQLKTMGVQEQVINDVMKVETQEAVDSILTGVPAEFRPKLQELWNEKQKGKTFVKKAKQE